MQPANLQLILDALKSKPQPVGDYVGQIQPGTPQYQDWTSGWGEAVRKPQDPAAYMKALPPEMEGATFPGSDMLWMRHGQPDKSQTVPTSSLDIIKLLQNG